MQKDYDYSYQRFLEAKGELWSEADSRLIARDRRTDESRFAQFKGNPHCVDAASNLFPHIDKDAVSSCVIDPTIVGEWFCRMTLGRNVKIGEQVNLMAHGGITLGDNVNLGKNSQIVTIGHGIHPSQREMLTCAPVIIEDDATVGEAAIIVNASLDGKPVRVGRGAVILPYSLVLGDVPEDATVGGRPAKVIEPISVKGENLAQHWAASVVDDLYDCQKLESVSKAREMLGDGVFIIPSVYIKNPKNIDVLDHCLLNRMAIIRAEGRINIGDGLKCAPGSVIDIKDFESEITFGKYIWVGAGARVLAEGGKKLHIGEGAIIAAGATVTENVPPMAVVVGNNRHVKTLSDQDILSVPSDYTGGLSL